MLGRMAGGVTEQREAPFDRAGNAVVSPSPLLAPPKLFLAAESGGGDSSGSSPVVAEAAATMSPTSTLQAAAGSPTSPAAAAVPFSRRRGAGGSPPGGDRRCHRPAWEARPAGLGLAVAGALNGDAAPPAATVLTGQSFWSPAVVAADRSARSSNYPSTSRGRRRGLMSPGEMEASEDYTRVIARGGAHPRTTHIFDDRGFSVGGAGEDDAFLRWCHGCSKDLGQGKDIFMYRGEMAFCSHECRYREMLQFDEES